MVNRYQLESFRKDNKIIRLRRNNDESREQFLLRVHFIRNNLARNELTRLIDLSYIFLNKYHFKQKFNSDIDKMMGKYDCTII
jgi:hypothetical protein